MIFQLIKQDPAYKAVPIMTLLGMLILPILLVNRDPSDAILGVHFADPLFLFFFFTSTMTWLNRQQGDTRFQSGLPIPVRDIFCARVFSTMLLVCLPAIGAAVSILIIQGMPSLMWATALLKLAILYPPIIALVQFVRILESRFGDHKILHALFYGACTGFPVIASNFPQFPAIQVSIGLSIAVLATVWYALPTTLELAPSNRRAKVAVRDDRPYLDWLPVVRSLFPFSGLVWLATLFYTTFSLSRFGNWTFPLFIIWFSAKQQRQGIAWLSAFPIRRRVLFSGIVGPILLVITIAFFLGDGHYAGPLPRQIWTLPSQSWPATAQEPDCARPNVVPPLEFWRHADGGRAGLIQSPWGETFEPPIVYVMRLPVYNPYAVGCKNSQRFFDWQFARATEAAYGRAMTSSEYQRPGHWVPPPVIPPIRMRLLNTAAFWGLALFVILITGLDNWYRFVRLSAAARWLIWSILIPIPFVAICALNILSPKTLVTSSDLVSDALQLASWTLPEDLAKTVLILALPLTALVWAIDKLLRESESVAKSAND